MATNASIAVVDLEGQVHSINLHWDGYIEFAGKILKEHYNNLDAALKLVSKGNLSVLGKYIEPSPDYPHNFESSQADVCLYYGRDRGEDNTDCIVDSNITEYIDLGCDYDYNYLFVDGEWKVSEDDLCNFKSYSIE